MFREAVEVNRSCLLFTRAQVGEDKVQSQEAASVRGDLKDPTRQTPTESLPGTSFSQLVKRHLTLSLSGWRKGTAVGIVCEYLLDYNALGFYIILQGSLNKVIMGEVIFVIKLVVTVGHKSWVLVL